MSIGPGNDPNVRLPDEVKRKIKLGEQRFQEHTAAIERESSPAAVPAVAAQEEAASSSLLAMEEPPQQPPADDVQQRLSQAEHRFATLQGRYRADMDRASKSVEELSAKLATATQQISDLSARILAHPPANGEIKKDLTKPVKLTTVTDEERRDFGDGFLDLVSRVANEVASQLVAGQVAELQTRTEALGTRLDQTTSHLKLTKDQRREAWMDKNVPAWQVTDNDPGFAAWLDQEDAYSGIKRMYILKKAMDDENFDRLKTIFGDFVKEQGAITPSSNTRPAQPPRVSLETQVLPNGGSGRVDAIVPNAPEAPMTAAEIAAHYQRKIRDPRGRSAAEITQIEERIARALASGNVRVTPRV